jgi:4-cresol dehydrogenase (hydroxylating)
MKRTRRDESAERHDLNAALRQWSELLGCEHVLSDAQTLAAYARSTSSCSTAPVAVLRPRSTDEVIGIVRIAGEFHIPLYPVSRGKNWGYGDACAVTDGQAIVDLGRMNRILEVDETLAYAVVEPGVTQRQLSEYLRERRIPLWMDCTGAGPDTSLIGNILERGFGHSPYGNRFQTVAGLQIVLANGQVLHTGFGHYPQAQTTHLFPYGIGPYLDGLFTQSNLGIVTRLGIWLMPAVEAINHFLCFVEKHEDIKPVIEALRPLRMNGTLRSIVHIGNDLRLISGGQTYPRDRAGGKVPLPEELRRTLRARAGVGAWTVSGALYGTARQVAVARSALRRALKGQGRKLVFITERKLALGESLAGLLGDSRWGRSLKEKLRVARALFDMNRGVPNGRFLAGAYWRRRGGLPPNFPSGADPLADNCGMLWLSPVIPMRGEDALRLHELIEPIFRQHGFDLFITFSMITERALGSVITVAYDKEDAAETERAQACYHALFDAVMGAGYIPYRVGIQSMADLAQGSQVFWDTVSAIKSALDPQRIIAPGRYELEGGLIQQDSNH